MSTSAAEKETYIHREAVEPEVTADRVAADVLKVDEARARELQEELNHSRQEGYVAITPEEKRAHLSLNRKFDLFVIPFCALVYLFNGLDRSNLGNAQTDNFSSDIGIPASAVNTATSLFFCTYVPLQPVAVALGKRVGQTTFLGIISLCWGILTLSHAFIKNQAQLIAIRLLIGVAEAGFYPTVVSYLAQFYPRYSLATRIAYFYGSYAIAGAFGGLIAFGCFQINGSLYGWQYLFIIEGACTIGISLFIPFWLPKAPGKAWFLDAEQKAYAEKRMILDSAANLNSEYKLSMRDVVEALKDWKLWITLPWNILASIAPQGFTIFFPLVVKGLGYSGANANLMTVPPYVIGTACLLVFAFSSDHFRERTGHILGALLIVIIGLIMTITIPLANTGGRYAGLVILLAGTFISAPITAAWLAGNTPEPGKRTIILGINGWGNLAGIIGSELYLSKYAPDYQYPLKVTLGLIVASFVGYAGVHVVLRLVNRSKAKKVASMTPEEIETENTSELRYADKKLTFVYGL
ncbi:major facilitator superfamily transporter [Calocera viscosa TUFC12733]|uniref:Major facilitator superfamily transporter n=1 Tax=Calocera viscosa (strain TUFC12733) TaxID=1330018 RepID=A0A167SAJ6_CALVF|nr:major facilitator superfamily transporter [Calocera viscosa TUFC12733]